MNYSDVEKVWKFIERNKFHRKLKLFSVSNQCMFDVHFPTDHCTYGLKLLTNIPKDATVITCFFSAERQSWMFVVYSEEFDIVSEDEAIPVFRGDFKIVLFRSSEKYPGLYELKGENGT